MKGVYFLVAIALLTYTYKHVIQADMINMFEKDVYEASTAIYLPNSEENLCVRSRKPMTNEVILTGLNISYGMKIPNVETAVFSRPCKEDTQYQFDLVID